MPVCRRRIVKVQDHDKGDGLNPIDRGHGEEDGGNVLSDFVGRRHWEKDMRIKGSLYLVLACWILGSGVAASETLDRIVAVVNGDVILYSELRDNVSRQEKNSPQAAALDQGKIGQLERETLQQMIRERLVEQEAVRLKISVTSKEVDDAIDDIKKGNQLTDAQLEVLIAKEGKTKEQFREGIRKELQRMRLIDRALKSKTVVTEAQVDAYIKGGNPLPPERVPASSGPAALDSPPSATSGEGRKLAVIFLPFSGDPDGKAAVETEKLAKEIRGKLKGGADFSRLAKEYSRGPAAAEGGDIGYVADDELSPNIASAVKGLKPDEFTEVVKAPSGYYIVKVLGVGKEKEKQKEKQKEPPKSVGDAATREQVRAKLYNEGLGHKVDGWVKELESRAYIQVLL